MWVAATCAAPAIPLAQAIGRWGNYFNQELFGGPVVFVPVEEEHAFRAVPVRLGPRAGGSVAIREGLAVGDRYVAAGAFTLKSEALAERLGGGHHH